MKFTRLIAIVFLVSTSAKADLMVSTTEINLGDTSKYCYAKTQNIIVYWTDPTSSEPPWFYYQSRSIWEVFNPLNRC